MAREGASPAAAAGGGVGGTRSKVAKSVETLTTVLPPLLLRRVQRVRLPLLVYDLLDDDAVILHLPHCRRHHLDLLVLFASTTAGVRGWRWWQHRRRCRLDRGWRWRWRWSCRFHAVVSASATVPAPPRQPRCTARRRRRLVRSRDACSYCGGVGLFRRRRWRRRRRRRSTPDPGFRINGRQQTICVQSLWFARLTLRLRGGHLHPTAVCFAVG